jgi:hypothetical protein
MSRPAFVLLLCSALASGAAFAADACPPAGQDLGALRLLREQKFAITEDAARHRLAHALLACLSSPDPELRDDIAYSAYSTWMRGKAVDVATLRGLSRELQARLKAAGDDEAGFGKPFAALVLSEVARTDRIEPWMTAEERAALIGTATDYLASIRDYRGYIDGQGWRHGVAHAADVMLQLALNPALDKAQLDQLLAAIAAQVPAANGHAYIHGEPGRLAAPVHYIGKRQLHTAGEWAAWFAKVAALPDGMEPDGLYRSETALARKHNVEAFLLQVHANASAGSDAELKARLGPGVVEALKSLP